MKILIVECHIIFGWMAEILDSVFTTKQMKISIFYYKSRLFIIINNIN
jgi:hypothetical protein